MLGKNSSLSNLTICEEVNRINEDAAALHRFKQQHTLFEKLELEDYTRVDDAIFLSRELNFLILPMRSSAEPIGHTLAA